MSRSLRLLAYVVATVVLPLAALGLLLSRQADPDDQDLFDALALAGAAVAGAVTYLALSVAYRSVTRTVEAISERARGIATGHVGRAQPIPERGPKEVAALAAAFNGMVDQVRRYTVDLERTQRDARRSVRRLGEALSGTHDLRAIISVTVETARTVLSGRTAVGWLVVEDSLQPRVVEGEERARRPVPLGQGLAGQVATTGNALLAAGDRAASEPQHDHALAVPVRLDGTVYAVIAVYGRTDSRLSYDQDDLDLLAALVQPAEAALDNARLHAEATRLSVTDGLTGLANRRELDRRMGIEVERHARFGEGFSLLLIDLDDFKVVNDQLGHPAGDRALIETARRVTAVTREVDVVARYGGEELAVLLPQADAPTAAIAAVRIRKAIADRPFELGDAARRITCSIGVAALPEHAVDRAGLLATADAALYRAKRAGKNRVERASVPAERSSP